MPFHWALEQALTSPVWNLFTRLPKKPGEKLMAKCKKCGKEYIAESNYGTKNLVKHMENCPLLTSVDVNQMLLSSSDGGVATRTPKFDQDKYRELLVKAITKHNLPFLFAEYEGIRELHTYLNPQVKHICRNTAKADVLKLYTKEKEKLRNFMNFSTGRINLTSDLWTSIATDGYICLTAHFIDNEYRLQKRVINFCIMTPPHTGVALCEKVFKLLVDWKIEDKLFSFTLDNASANDVFVEMLRYQLNLKQSLLVDGDFFHVRCCAHILNLIVQDGLKCIDNCVVKIRDIIKYLKGSQVRKKRFLECVSHARLELKHGLRQDVPTRWNSTFLMLTNAIYYQHAFLQLKFVDSNYIYCPTLEEWGKASKIANFLGCFYNITCIFSGTNYPTSNLFFPQVFMLQHTLKLGIEDYDDFISNIAKEMHKKFDKYWGDYNLLLAIACILDPRYKIQFVEFSYTRLYGKSSKEFDMVKTKLFSLYHEYASKVAKETPPSTSCEQNQNQFPYGATTLYSQGCMDVMKEFDSFESMEFSDISQKTQLELYLDEPRTRMSRDINLDILVFWKSKKFQYPVLSLMARDILSIPISTVASESAFSIGGRILSETRSMLNPENVEALICTRDWLYGDGLKDVVSQVDDLTEDVLDADTIGSQSTQSSNTINLEN